jgi:hypothetical protein
MSAFMGYPFGSTLKIRARPVMEFKIDLASLFK